MPDFELGVRFLDGHCQRQRVHPSTTVAELRARLEEGRVIPDLMEVKLLRDTRPLEDSERLGLNLKLRIKATLDLRVIPRGAATLADVVRDLRRGRPVTCQEARLTDLRELKVLQDPPEEVQAVVAASATKSLIALEAFRISQSWESSGEKLAQTQVRAHTAISLLKDMRDLDSINEERLLRAFPTRRRRLPLGWSNEEECIYAMNVGEAFGRSCSHPSDYVQRLVEKLDAGDCLPAACALAEICCRCEEALGQYRSQIQHWTTARAIEPSLDALATIRLLRHFGDDTDAFLLRCVVSDGECPFPLLRREASEAQRLIETRMRLIVKGSPKSGFADSPEARTCVADSPEESIVSSTAESNMGTI